MRKLGNYGAILCIFFYFSISCLRADRVSRDVSTAPGLINDMLYLMGIAYSVDSVSNLSDPFNNGGETYFSIMRQSGTTSTLYLVQTQDGVTFTGYPVSGQQFARLLGTPRTVSVMTGAVGAGGYVYYFTQYDEMDDSGNSADHANHYSFTSSGTLNPATTPVILPVPMSPTLGTGEIITKVFHYVDGSSNRYYLTGNLSTNPYELYFSSDFVTAPSKITFGGLAFRDANNPCERVYLVGGTIACGFWSGAAGTGSLGAAGSTPGGALGNGLMANEEVRTNFVSPAQVSGPPNYSLDFYFGGTYYPSSLFAGTARPISLGYTNPRKFRLVGDGSNNAIVFLADFCDAAGCGTHLVFVSAPSESQIMNPPTSFGPILDVSAMENGIVLSNSKLGVLPTNVQFLYIEKGLLGAQKLMMLKYDIASGKLTGPVEVIINYL
ncbi:hypothetical protein CH373_03440 [Leptospira perolatii]|uniref:Lipoprotein n=1 Tax=Leptospira perolatii TaxID=2023191 RepID=A0A2M9ZSN3_9LEPT|nr:hypothetical protein [Leptospira perolatii]PJZ68727.1 hypothetical protein CH360_14320 [Leptospira perolatii]PJZ75082.1 hypothetical protein CH373_03440 [Leptospira perolatii]